MPEASTPAARHAPAITPGNDAPRRVFVYGTLRAGDDNDITRLQPAPRFVGHGTVHGTLYHLGRYPGLRLAEADDSGPTTDVLGEVYEVSPELERVLDEIEELYPQQTNEYFKREIKVHIDGVPVRCFVYEINPIYITGRPVIASGDWVRDR